MIWTKPSHEVRSNSLGTIFRNLTGYLSLLSPTLKPINLEQSAVRRVIYSLEQGYRSRYLPAEALAAN